jgi:ABC-2 type transport system permease protein
MDILKTSTDWAKAELWSNGFFALFGVMFVVASLLFWSRGETDMAKAFVLPMFVAGVLMLILGGGLFYGSWKYWAGFGPAIAEDGAGFIASEIERVDRTKGQYGTAVFKVMPLMIAAAAVLIVFVHSPGWRAAFITANVFLGLIMLIDSNANARLEAYKETLVSAVSGRSLLDYNQRPDELANSRS